MGNVLLVSICSTRCTARSLFPARIDTTMSAQDIVISCSIKIDFTRTIRFVTVLNSNIIVVYSVFHILNVIL